MRKIHKKSPVPWSLVFDKVDGWRHNISSKSMQNLSFLHHLRSVFPYNWKLQYLFKLNSVKSCLVIANKKTSKYNEARIFTQSRQGRWIFFLDLELE